MIMGEEGRAMKARRHTPEQVIRKLREADRLLSQGKEVGVVCRQLESPRRRITAGATSMAG